MGIPDSSAFFLVVRMQTAPPSPSPLALPAVVRLSPHSKTGFSLDNDSNVVPLRMVSSAEMTVPCISIGIISSAHIPLRAD